MSTKPVSEILSAYAHIKAYSEEHRPRLLLKVKELKKSRRELMKRALSAGLKIRESNFPEALDDIFETDDSGKLLDTFFKVKVSTKEDVQAAITFCKDEKILALPIGAKTSALGVFEARALAERFGLKGIIGISFDNVTAGEPISDLPSSPRISLPKLSSEYTECTWASSSALAVCYTKKYAENFETPPVVVTHAGCHIDDINLFLQKTLDSDKIRFRLMPDPTSKADAQVGGILATGAEGGNRTQAAEDIAAITIVDADGKVHRIVDESAKQFVGLNGNAGIICEAEFYATAFPKYEHGFFIPLQGHGTDAWKAALEFQSSIKNYCYSVHPHPRVQIGPGSAGTIITGIELLSKSALDIALRESEDRFEWIIQELMEHSELGIFVTFSTFHSIHDEALFSDLFISESLGLNIQNATTDSSDNFIIDGNALFNKIRFLSGDELSHMDRIRHSAPSHSRELAKKMGGVSESTDLNIRFHSLDPEENKRAIDTVAELYATYESSFSKESGFQVSTYGHLHPGVGIGGGIDPHVRAIFELSNPGSRYNAPEQVAELKRRHQTLIRKLLQLDGKDGIEIVPPEKGRFASSEYWNWYCLTQPDKARTYLDLCVTYGIATSETGDQLATIAGRIPHVLPGILKPLRNGVIGLLDPAFLSSTDESLLPAQYNSELSPYWTAILNLCQEHPQSGKIRRLLSHTLLRTQEYFNIPLTSYAFFIESKEEATEILHRNFSAESSIPITILSPTHGDKNIQLSPDRTYVIDLTYFKIPEGVALFIVPHSVILEAYQNNTNGINRAVFRNLYDMWVRWPFDTLETPHIAAIASLGLLLDSEKWKHQKSIRPSAKTISAEAGPTQLHSSQFKSWNQEIHGLPDIKQSITSLKDFIGISHEYDIGFASSATACMQLFADAVSTLSDSIQLIQVTNDASSDRFNSILKKAGCAVKTITTSWTTGENSELIQVCSKVESLIDSQKTNIILITPHKTATTADVHPDHIIKRLAGRGLMMGLHYHMVCDITSGVGARNYATLLSPDSGLMRMPFTGCIGACNRALGIPSGLAFIALSPALSKILGIDKDSARDNSLHKRFNDSRNGTVHLRWGLLNLQKRISESIHARESIAHIEAQSRQKMNLILGWMEQHHDLIALVPNAYDRSPLIMGIFSQAKNMIVTKRLLQEVFGIHVGSGFGPFEREGFRLYIPTLTIEQVTELLASLDVVLNLDDVIFSRGENIPNIALREPHDPLAVISRVSESCTVDDIIKDQLGLDWLGRLIQTYNANMAAASQKIQLGGKIPHISTGHHAKAQIYGESNNIREMRKILHLRNEETKLELTFHYQLYKETENHLRGRILGFPTARWDDQDFCPAIVYLLAKAREHLSEIARLLNKYVDGYLPASTISHSAKEIKASRDREGRVEWPIVA